MSDALVSAVMKGHLIHKEQGFAPVVILKDINFFFKFSPIYLSIFIPLTRFFAILAHIFMVFNFVPPPPPIFFIPFDISLKFFICMHVEFMGVNEQQSCVQIYLLFLDDRLSFPLHKIYMYVNFRKMLFDKIKVAYQSR